jgi:hypothetical protein
MSELFELVSARPVTLSFVSRQDHATRKAQPQVQLELLSDAEAMFRVEEVAN